MKIFKYEMSAYGWTELVVPVGSKLLSVQNQQERLAAWMAVPEVPAGHEHRHFMAMVTGGTYHQPAPPKRLEHVATVQFNNGSFVLHIFELINGESSNAPTHH